MSLEAAALLRDASEASAAALVGRRSRSRLLTLASGGDGGPITGDAIRPAVDERAASARSAAVRAAGSRQRRTTSGSVRTGGKVGAAQLFELFALNDHLSCLLKAASATSD